MGKALRITLVVVGVLFVAGGLVFAGSWIGHGNMFGYGYPVSAYRMMNGNGSYDGGYGRGYGPGMMNGSGGYGGRYGYGYGPGMMDGWNGSGMMNGGGTRRGFGPGMMGGYGTSNPAATPLTVDQAYQVAGKYLTALNNPDLKIAEVMVFDNNAYVRVIEQSTGIGAFELLVNPTNLAVTPEPGPNMMWNLKYSAMNHQAMMGGFNGMMYISGASNTPAAVPAQMTISAAQALQDAQQFLDTALPGTKTAADADAFYGYYTIDILRDGAITGMLSVNGSSGQVFLHTWHGTFIASQDY